MRQIVDWWIGAARARDPLAVDPDSGLIGAVVVTGGSDGIGREIAQRFAASGHHVVLVARDPARLKSAVQALRASNEKAAISAIPLDVTTATAPSDMTRQLEAMGLECEILVNAAGVGVSGATVAQPAEALEHVVALNVTAAVRLTRHMLPRMLEARRGGVIQIASFGGLLPGPYQAGYYASKAFIISFTEALAWECRAGGVRMSVVAPGPVETRFHARMGAESALYRRVFPAMAPERVAASAVTGFWLGRTLIIPGAFFSVLALLLRLTPRFAQRALMGLLLKPRGDDRDV